MKVTQNILIRYSRQQLDLSYWRILPIICGLLNVLDICWYLSWEQGGKRIPNFIHQSQRTEIQKTKSSSYGCRENTIA